MDAIKNHTVKITIGTIATLLLFVASFAYSNGIRDNNIEDNTASITVLNERYHSGMKDIRDGMLRLVEDISLIKGALQIK